MKDRSSGVTTGRRRRHPQADWLTAVTVDLPESCAFSALRRMQHDRPAVRRRSGTDGLRNDVLGWTPRAVIDIARTCKLYDIAAGRWLDFEGTPTS
jgi:hypothetical protein